MHDKPYTLTMTAPLAQSVSSLRSEAKLHPYQHGNASRGSCPKNSGTRTSAFELLLAGARGVDWSVKPPKKPASASRVNQYGKKHQDSCVTDSLTPMSIPEYPWKSSGRTYAPTDPVDSLTLKMSLLSLKPTDFFDLPTEIRNHIYCLVLGRPTLHMPTDMHREYEPGLFRLGKSKLSPPNITLVSKQLRSETLPIFYAESIFVLNIRLPLVKTFCQWILAIGPINASYLTTVRLRLSVSCGTDDTVKSQPEQLIVKLLKGQTYLYIGSSVALTPHSQNALAGPVRDWLANKKRLTGRDLLRFVAAMINWDGKLQYEHGSCENRKQILYPVKFFPDLGSASEPATASTREDFAQYLRAAENAVMLDYDRKDHV